MNRAEAVVQRLLETHHAALDQRGSEFNDGSQFAGEVSDLFLSAITPDHGWNQQSFNRLKLAAVKYLRLMADDDEGFKGHDITLVKQARKPEEIADVLKRHDDRPGEFLRIVNSFAESEEDVDWTTNPDDPDSPSASYMKALAPQGWTTESIEHFRDCADVFIQWMAREEELDAEGDLAVLRRATDPDQIITVLKKWDTDPEITFLAFVSEYC